eukprot:m.186785 g.186785  ORF g.186785 m.186785 type:complete len:73 (-) comp14761_c2_seq3:1295-1513(-)
MNDTAHQIQSHRRQSLRKYKVDVFHYFCLQVVRGLPPFAAHDHHGEGLVQVNHARSGLPVVHCSALSLYGQP